MGSTDNASPAHAGSSLVDCDEFYGDSLICAVRSSGEDLRAIHTPALPELTLLQNTRNAKSCMPVPQQRATYAEAFEIKSRHLLKTENSKR